MERLDVGVVGCGTAGPAAALFLARQGHDVTLYERVAAPRPVGAGIILQPTGQAVMARLGLLDAVLARGERLDGLRVRDADQRVLLHLDYASVDPRLFGLGLHRGVLFEALFAAAQVEPRVTLRLGVTVERVARAATGRYVLLDAAGEHHGPHDLIVAADGARSRLRDDTGLARVVEPYPWGALWFVARDPERRWGSELHQTVDGTRSLLGLLPTGIGPATDEVEDGSLVSVFWSIRCDAVDAWRRGGLGPWKARVLALEPDAGSVLAQIEAPEQVLFSQYHDVVMHPWNTRSIVHLGDAAHAMSPQLGQGANLALWDAMVLADAIAAEPRSLGRALDAYTRSRRGHLGYYQWVTRALTPFFQSDHDALGVLRDALLPLAARFSLGRRAMLMGMCGTADGHPWRWVAGVPGGGDPAP